MKQFLSFLLLGLASILSFAQSGSGMDNLVAALAPLKQLQGNFTQRQYDPQSALLAETSGRFSLLRPGYFAWEIREPSEQLIIADPEFVWHHDHDLETVTRRPVSGSAEWSPLQILGGDESALRQNFQVQQLAGESYLLTPLSTQFGFNKLTLTLDGSTLKKMEIEDSLGQLVEIDFSDLDSVSPLGKEDFAFTPPAGADLFYYDE